MATPRKPTETRQPNQLPPLIAAPLEWYNNRRRTQATTPLWRRVTALFSLGLISILAGVALAGLLGLTVLLLLVALERAIG